MRLQYSGTSFPKTSGGRKPAGVENASPSEIPLSEFYFVCSLFDSFVNSLFVVVVVVVVVYLYLFSGC